jgi:ligand-binding sensor domain-containing protein
MRKARVKPHIARRYFVTLGEYLWVVTLRGEIIYQHSSRDDALVSAQHVWRFQ